MLLRRHKYTRSPDLSALHDASGSYYKKWNCRQCPASNVSTGTETSMAVLVLLGASWTGRNLTEWLRRLSICRAPNKTKYARARILFHICLLHNANPPCRCRRQTCGIRIVKTLVALSPLLPCLTQQLSLVLLTRRLLLNSNAMQDLPVAQQVGILASLAFNNSFPRGHDSCKHQSKK